MSTETAAQKKTFLTRAMEAVAAKENGEASETEETISTKTVYKRIAVVTGLVVAGGTVVALVAKRIMNSAEEETSEEATPQD